MTCTHWDGDTVNGYWLCAKCFAKLQDRPRRYHMSGVEGGDVPPRQEVTLAPVAKADGTTLAQFVHAMALRLIARTGGSFDKADALEYAIEILRTFSEPFGSDDLDWTSAGAWELVDEDLQHWDADESASN
ncbi:hypothetical protein Q4598_04100 [Phaeobacter inhibens]|uniref:hypothetical protein n=1 Tax=Phaeobacter inhibens TaxID=221822 RepID=UPI0026E3D58D|nr:hypothetical protein [Phaeobacter inhibens]MDO6755402.1 hypothetical protein [Phaeobacter inhibens]